MKKRIFTAVAVVLVAVFSIATVFAGYSSGDAKSEVASGIRVFDYANLMSDEAEEAASLEITKTTTNTGMDMGIVVIDDAEGKTSMEYADDFYDYNGFGPDGVLFLVDMDNRNLWISTKGECIRYLTDSRIDSILDVSIGFMPDNIDGCVKSFINECNDWLSRGIPDDQYNYDTETGEVDPYEQDRPLTAADIIEGIVLSLVVAVVIGCIPCICVAIAYNSIGKQYRYPVESRTSMNVVNSQDIFLREHTSSQRIETNSGGGRGGSGRSSTHSSRSGSSHGGGGRSF